ncbi:MAG: AMP-dependent synthetase [Spirochaetae bacterium HGW-Spirochaetae-5]|nr:MAG: AMP-dependent synthetase [Spirochaetae bacterium HGW-Spirochaetae-5]
MTRIEQWRWEKEDLKPVSWHFYNSCSRFPARNAQIFNAKLYSNDNKGRFTWSEMRDRVESICCGLMAIGLNKGDRVAIMSESSPYWTHADMALACTGGVSVTIFPTLNTKEVVYIMNDSESRFIFVGNEELLDKTMASFNDIPKLEKVVILDINYKSSDSRIIGMQELIDKGNSWKEEHYFDFLNRKESITLDDWYTIIYTSGTTGPGKGVILTHFNCSSRMAGADEFLERYGMALDENDVTLCFLPLAHIFDRGSCQLAAIYHSSTIAYADKVGTLINDLRKYNPTWINCVPRLYEKMYLQLQYVMNQHAFKKRILTWALNVGYEVLEYRKDAKGCYNMHKDFDVVSKLGPVLRLKFKLADKILLKIRSIFGTRFRFSLSSTAAISADLLKYFYAIGVPIVEGYGLTESFNACIVNPITALKPGYIGINACGSQSRVSDEGELEITGAGVFKEYLNQPEWTDELFTEDGWFRTGDMVTVDEHGYYKISDRKKSIICTDSGKNISPFKIVDLFTTSSYIDQILIVGDDRRYISALIVPNYNYFIDLFDKEGVKYKKDMLQWDDYGGFRTCIKVGEDFIANYQLQELINDEIDAANCELESYEKIKQYTILTERFTEMNGLLTPSQKVKKKEIIERFAKEIDSMYE